MKFGLNQNVGVQKIFQTLVPRFGKGHNESCQKFHPLHGMDESEQNTANIE
jgi:hypothetical protein